MLYKTARRLVIGVIGATVLILSIVGYIMPIIPGIPLTILGLAILGTEFLWARHLLKKVRATAEDFFDRVKGRKVNRVTSHEETTTSIQEVEPGSVKD